MIPLPAPSFSAQDIIDVVGTGKRTSRVVAAAATVLDVEERARQHAESAAWYSMPRDADSISPQLADDLRYVYASKLASKKGNARLYYNALRSLAPRSKCPICAERQVAALDHYLPKETWPGLAFVPENLYPICGTCNHRKSSDFAETGEEQFLHPYFDDLGQDEWIVARVLEVPGAPLEFEILPPRGWSEEFTQRVRKHYDRFALFDLYKDNAADLLADHLLLLEERYEQGDIEGVSLLFADQARSLRHARQVGRGVPSRWPYIAMQAWADSTWFAEHAGWRT